MKTKNNYIDLYNKKNYKMYQFRVKKEDKETIEFLDTLEKRNSYILSLIERDMKSGVYSLKEITDIIKPILKKYGINEVFIFGSYARGDANKNSDIDIYCERGNIKTYIDLGIMEEELKLALQKKVDVIFIGSQLNDRFLAHLEKDKVKIC